MKWAPDADEGILVAGGNNQGSALNQLTFPHKINVHSSGDIYIADEGNDRIIKWSPGASDGVVVAGGSFGTGNNDDLTRTKMPRGLFVTEDRRIFISEYENNRVTVWKQGNKNGALISKGRTNSPFNDPTVIFVYYNCYIYVADMMNGRVV